jgi:hypothetical protein
MTMLDRWKKFFFSSPVPRVERVGDLYTTTASAYDTNPLIGKGANAYTLQQFQTLPSVNMLMGNGRIPPNFFKALGQNNLVALRPAGPPQDVVGIPVGETDLFPEATEV